MMDLNDKQNTCTTGCDCTQSSNDYLKPQSPEEKRLAHFSFRGFLLFLIGQTNARLGLIGVFFLSVSMVLRYAGIPDQVIFGIQIAGLVVAGYPLALNGLKSLIVHHEFSINLLMTIAAIGAVVLGNYEESITLVLLFTLAEVMEEYTTNHAHQVLAEITELSPAQALKINGAVEEMIEVEKLIPGDCLLIKPGEKIPMDGIVTQGSSEVNQAPITGESIPVLKENGDPLYAGTINGSGVLKMTVTGTTTDNTISRIITLITNSQNSRSRRERLIDRFARVYTPAIFFLSLLVATVPPLFLGLPFLNDLNGNHGWLYRGISILVIGCPCALVLSTPIAALSGIIRAVHNGVLFKGGAFIEGLSRINVFAFDKTGTLTRGEPTVACSHSVYCNQTGPCNDCEYCNDVLALAGSMERHITHPIAKAVINEATARGLMDVYPPAEDVVVSSGHGISGTINGKQTIIASHKHFDDNIDHDDSLCSAVTQAEADGYTTMMLFHEPNVAGYISVSDSPRPESAEIITQLNKMNKKTVMLTGDNEQTASSIGKRLNMDQIFAHLLPEDKVNLIKSLHHDLGLTAMVGDGINDAPAMAAADIGIAVGGAASGQALETSDVILMANNLKQLPFSIGLSNFVQRIIKQNLAVSLGIKAIFLILALMGLTPLWLAVLADSGMAVVVVLNSLRPLKFQKIV